MATNATDFQLEPHSFPEPGLSSPRVRYVWADLQIVRHPQTDGVGPAREAQEDCNPTLVPVPSVTSALTSSMSVSMGTPLRVGDVGSEIGNRVHRKVCGHSCVCGGGSMCMHV